MILRTIAYLTIAAGLLFPGRLTAQTTNALPPAHASPATNADQTYVRLQALNDRVQGKYAEGNATAADFAGELKELDDLIASKKDAQTDEAAQMTYMKAMLYVEVIKDFDQGADIMRQIITNYPHTAYSASAEKLLPKIAQASAGQKNEDRLAAGTVFPDFTVTNLDGGPLSVGALKGKVVLVDFWATWCPPCRAALPDVIAVYNKHHAEGFEIIGVSLDSDREALDSFLKKQAGMTWPQYFDGEGWNNQLAAKYGVQAIPYTVLIGPDGKIIDTRVDGDDLEAAVAKALGKK
jgi:thiol-disulfide isomerase/thioredoxin